MFDEHAIIRIYYINMGDALRQFKSEIFQGLATSHPDRDCRALRDGELSAGKLIEKLGIEQANASQHLAVLRAKQIVVNRKVGNQVFYSIRDHALIEVLDILRRYFYSQLSSTVSMMKEVARQEPKASRQHASMTDRGPFRAVAGGIDCSSAVEHVGAPASRCRARSAFSFITTLCTRSSICPSSRR